MVEEVKGFGPFGQSAIVEETTPQEEGGQTQAPTGAYTPR